MYQASVFEIMSKLLDLTQSRRIWSENLKRTNNGTYQPRIYEFI
jgi:hypothetical protein